MPLQKIMVIRYAEKPIPDVSTGVRASGKSDAASLSSLGWQRAGAGGWKFSQTAQLLLAGDAHSVVAR